MCADGPSTVRDIDGERFDLAVIGGGLRSVVLLLQLGTLRVEEVPERIAVVEPARLGAGRIWRTTQPTLLVMNTLANQSTVFEDAEAVASESERPGKASAASTGPSLAQWRRVLADRRTPREMLSCEAETWPSDLRAHLSGWARKHPETVRNVIESTQGFADETYFPRAVFGGYLEWAIDYAVHRLPERVTVTHVRDFAVDLEELDRAHVRATGMGAEIRLASKATVSSSSVILALGWGLGATRPSMRGPSRISQNGGAPGDAVAGYLGADSPIDQDLTEVRAGSDVLIRGMGMSMFDTLTLLTQGRGGRVERRGGRLEYLRSGEEPRIFIGSRRGLPFRAQARPTSRPVQPEMPHLRALIARLPSRDVDFGDVRAALDRDAIRRFYSVRHRLSSDPVYERLIEGLDRTDDARERQELESHLVPDPTLRFPALATASAIPASIKNIDEYERWIQRSIELDIAEAALGEDSAVKMALEVYVAARSLFSDVAGFGRISAETYPNFLASMKVIGAVGGVPPLFRVEEFDALLRAGVVRLIGPDTEVLNSLGSRHEVRSRFTTTTVDTVIDAFLPRPGIEQADDLLIALRKRGTVSRYRYANRIDTEAVGVRPDTNAVLRSDGSPSACVFSVGMLSEAARVFTIIAPIPGTDSPVLRECRAALAAAIGYARSSPVSARSSTPITSSISSSVILSDGRKRSTLL